MISYNISLKPFNTFGIDVSARHFAAFSNTAQLAALLSDDVVKKNRQLVLGGGSNLLLTKNFDGIVLKNELKGITAVSEDDTHYYVRVGAGEVWHQFVMHSIKKNYAGIENLALIPGCVGASPMQNIGAYGVEIKDVFHSLEAMRVHDGHIKTFSLDECAFGYRESVFKRKEKGNWIILSVTYRLNKRPVLNTSYGAIDAELEKMNLDRVTIKDIAHAVINIRSSKLPDPAQVGNAGSFFKNPVVPMQMYEKIKSNYNNAPCYPLNENEVKVPAGWLIEQAGWKGKTFDTYGVHKNQALVLVNYGGARGQQIYDLSTRIIEDIQSKFGIELEREVNIL
ncbi:MAG: UDP-N-acetylmuramate dehydrogenase [Flavobacteriales bacterium]